MEPIVARSKGTPDAKTTVGEGGLSRASGLGIRAIELPLKHGPRPHDAGPDVRRYEGDLPGHCKPQKLQP